MSNRYCVIIPAFESARTIGELVSCIKRQGLDVIVVNDGSRDKTASAASEQGAIVISHLRNRGKGCALRTGFDYALRAAYDGVITLDSDGQHDPQEIPKLIEAIERKNADVALGNRMDNGMEMPFLRRCTNGLMSGIVSFAARKHIPDSQCGFRLIRKEVLHDVQLQSRRFEIETEFLLSAIARRWKIISVPVRSIYLDRNSHIRPLREGLRFTGVLLRHLTWRFCRFLYANRSPQQAQKDDV